MRKLFGEKFVDPLFWIREEVIEVVEARQSNNVCIIYLTFLELNSIIKLNSNKDKKKRLSSIVNGCIRKKHRAVRK